MVICSVSTLFESGARDHSRARLLMSGNRRQVGRGRPEPRAASRPRLSYAVAKFFRIDRGTRYGAGRESAACARGTGAARSPRRSTWWRVDRSSESSHTHRPCSMSWAFNATRSGQPLTNPRSGLPVAVWTLFTPKSEERRASRWRSPTTRRPRPRRLRQRRP